MDQANTNDQKGKALSFADVSMAIDNRMFIGDVSDMDLDLLEQILPHSFQTQLIHIEKFTKDRDLSPVTNKLWKSFYEKIESTDSVSEIMKEWNLKFKWSDLYQEKSKRVKEAEKKEDDRKLSQQVRFARRFHHLQAIKETGQIKSKLMRKIVKEYLHEMSRDVKHTSYGKGRRKLMSYEYSRCQGCFR
ncbi:putative RNA polymerase II transcription factor SIII, subunit A [Rosa chinensis]|uniref:Putative RNA polymerase II transcription factor SIII, subunit A n=1 Tax=Rosa chinensis TaxID=74649 RepID=A0A2P6SD10_ROSCH|nr:uncharacterized protein LOC112164683 [Rosa chinensis]PRQ56565.1 putative RNA polymerase II transcription factor SIII, subunit A [Rosa chinensis]